LDTPEFLLWAIEHRCPIRGFQDGSDLERTERQLRAARAYSDALNEGRVFEGLALAPPNGFHLDQALAIYGGESALESACGTCQANALCTGNRRSLAGCYGIVPLPSDRQPLNAAIEEVISAQGSARPWPPTRPRWYGLWLESPVRGTGLRLRIQALSAVVIKVSEPEFSRAIHELLTALNVAFERGLCVHVRLFPRGRVERNWWRVVAHCPTCRAEWPEEQVKRCLVCGCAGSPAPARKRRARGQRPYFPLDRLLGERQAAELLARFNQRPVPPESPVPARSPLLPERPDIPPAG
jgi:hypothetical protein